jgi:hypothetical protein
LHQDVQSLYASLCWISKQVVWRYTRGIIEVTKYVFFGPGAVIGVYDSPVMVVIVTIGSDENSLLSTWVEGPRVCGREAIDCTHSGGLKRKISVNRLSSRQARAVLAVGTTRNGVT